MDTADIIQTLFYARERADNLWNFLLTVHLGLTTGLFLLRTRLTWFIKLTMLTVYLGFMLFNNLGFTATHEVMYAAYDTLAQNAGDDQKDLLHILAAFSRERTLIGTKVDHIIPWIHSVMAFFGTLLIIFAGPGQKKSEAFHA